MKYFNLKLNLTKSSKFEEQIKKDVYRTFGHNLKPNSLEGLQRLEDLLSQLLKLYSLVDPEVGYCQGMNYIAGSILLALDVEENLQDDQDYMVLESDQQLLENSFWCLSYIMMERQCRELFKPGMALV